MEKQSVDTISGRIESLQNRIGALRKASPLAAPHVTLLGACKGQGVEVIEKAIEAGLTHFGENRVQEAEGHWESLRQKYPRVKLHLIGPLQTNKAGDAIALFDVIETIDREKLADTIAAELKKNPAKKIECYIQVNTGKEPQKAGVLPEAADALIVHCKKLSLPVTGLMCVPPASQPPAPHFALLRDLAKKHALANLSMGMSDDFETAIRMGSTSVRIGRAIFGERS